MILLALAAQALAQEVVLFDPGASEVAQRFSAELTLSVDAVTVLPVPDGFVEAALPVQLQVVREELGRDGVNAVVWLDESRDDVLGVALAYVEASRAVIRVIDQPRQPGVEASLVLATRELLTPVYTAPPPEPVPETPDPAVPEPPPPPEAAWGWRVGAVGTVVPAPLGGGLRGGLAIEAERRLGGPTWAMLGVQGGGGATQWRVGPVAGVRSGWVLAGARVDAAVLSWAVLAQPRLYVGLGLPGDGPSADLRVLLAPVRDRVERGDLRHYDSGWVEFELAVGWGRKIPGG